eukprot:3117524-Ditylum_brightwellii.AAC.1
MLLTEEYCVSSYHLTLTKSDKSTKFVRSRMKLGMGASSKGLRPKKRYSSCLRSPIASVNSP